MASVAMLGVCKGLEKCGFETRAHLFALRQDFWNGRVGAPLPPASASVVVSDDFGPITIEFGVPVTSFGGFFNYLVPLTLEAFDSTDTLVDSAYGWLERALAGQKDTDVLCRWWGRDDWTDLRAMSRDERRDALVQRMKKDLGYKSVKAWPIYERESGGAIMYYMIHATDHPEAPKLMSRAYRRAVYPLEPLEQLKLELVAGTKGPVSHSNPLLLARGAALT